MTILKFEPLKNLTIDETLMEDLFNSKLKNQTSNGFSPKIDISEDEKNYYLECELPGLKKEDLVLTIENNLLTLKGDKKRSIQPQKKKYNYSERSFGSFKRTFSLSENINVNGTNAEFENGVLYITIPKILKAVPNEFQIKIN